LNILRNLIGHNRALKVRVALFIPRVINGRYNWRVHDKFRRESHLLAPAGAVLVAGLFVSHCGGAVMTQEAHPGSEAIQEWSIAHIAKLLDVPPEKINPAVDIDALGLDSTTAVAYMMSLEEWLGIELMPELLFDYTTIQSLSRHVASLAQQAA
jgi:acyl carrier protein